MAVVAGVGIAVLSAVVWYGIDALLGRGSPAGRPSSGVLVLFLAVAVVYGALWGLLVGLAAALLLPGRAGPGGRRTGFAVVCVLLVAGALAVLRAAAGLPLLWLTVPALLCAVALVLYLRWVPAGSR